MLNMTFLLAVALAAPPEVKPQPVEGDRVRITTTSPAKTVIGTLESLDAETIQLRVGPKRSLVTLQRDDIKGIDLSLGAPSRGSRILQGMGMGFATAAVGGFVVGSTIATNENNACRVNHGCYGDDADPSAYGIVGAILFAPVGATAGAVVGAVVPPTAPLVYRLGGGVLTGAASGALIGAAVCGAECALVSGGVSAVVGLAAAAVIGEVWKPSDHTSLGVSFFPLKRGAGATVSLSFGPRRSH